MRNVPFFHLWLSLCAAAHAAHNVNHLQVEPVTDISPHDLLPASNKAVGSATSGRMFLDRMRNASAPSAGQLQARSKQASKMHAEDRVYWFTVLGAALWGRDKPESKVHAEDLQESYVGTTVFSLIICCLLLGWLWQLGRLYIEFQAANVGFGEENIGFHAYVSYKFENWHQTSRYPNYYIILYVTTVILIIGAACYGLLVDAHMLKALWKVFGFLVDPGTAVAEKAHSGAGFFLLGVLSIFGIIIFALTLMLMENSFTTHMIKIKDGTSRVMETGHYLIIGFNADSISIVKDLCLAHDESGGATIVLVSENLSKSVMENHLVRMEVERYGTRIITRCGIPSNRHDLWMVAASSAKAIVILPDDTISRKELRDALAFKVLVTLRSEGWPLQGRIIVSCSLPNNVLSFEGIGGDNTDVVMLDRFLAKLVVESSRQSGLASVLHALLGFGGSELYVTEVPEMLVGETFEEAAAFYPKGMLLGLRSENARPITPSESSSNFSCSLQVTSKCVHRWCLCPCPHRVLEKGDSIVVLAADSHAAHTLVKPCPKATIKRQLSLQIRRSDQQSIDGAGSSPMVPLGLSTQQQSILIVGWHSQAAMILFEIDQRLAVDALVTIVSSTSEEDRKTNISTNASRWNKSLTKIKNIQHIHASVGCMYALEQLNNPKLTEYDRIFLLADENMEDDEEADACTFLTIVHIREMLLKNGGSQDVTIIPELKAESSDSRCNDIKIRDFIHSKIMRSQIMAMIAYEPRVRPIINELVSDVGSASFAICTLDYYGPAIAHQETLKLTFNDIKDIINERYDSDDMPRDILVGWTRPFLETKQAEYELKMSLEEQSSEKAKFHQKMAKDFKTSQKKKRIHEFVINPEDRDEKREWVWDEDKVIVLTPALQADGREGFDEMVPSARGFTGVRSMTGLGKVMKNR